MWSDVVDLHEFYRSQLGQVARRLIRGRIRAFWPEVRGMTVLGLGYATPYLRQFLDRLLIVHAAEYSENQRAMMREAWRVLSGNGRLLMIIPNRRGIWARIESTPIGHGRPYSPGQLKRLLKDCLFTPELSENALYLPPTPRRMLLHSAPAFERIGSRYFNAISGVILVEATKQIYAAAPFAKTGQRRRLITLPGQQEVANG